MISEGSRDTGDWSDDAENASLSQEYITFYKTVILNSNNISPYL